MVECIVPRTRINPPRLMHPREMTLRHAWEGMPRCSRCEKRERDVAGDVPFAFGESLGAIRNIETLNGGETNARAVCFTPERGAGDPQSLRSGSRNRDFRGLFQLRQSADVWKPGNVRVDVEDLVWTFQVWGRPKEKSLPARGNAKKRSCRHHARPFITALFAARRLPRKDAPSLNAGRRCMYVRRVLKVIFKNPLRSSRRTIIVPSSLLSANQRTKSLVYRVSRCSLSLSLSLSVCLSLYDLITLTTLTCDIVTNPRCQTQFTRTRTLAPFDWHRLIIGILFSSSSNLEAFGKLRCTLSDNTIFIRNPTAF